MSVKFYWNCYKKLHNSMREIDSHTCIWMIQESLRESILWFSVKVRPWFEMHYHSCVCVCAFLGIQSPRIGLILGRGLYSIIFSLSAFLGQLLYILTFYSTFLCKNAKLRIKKKKKQVDPFFQIFWVGRKRAKKHLCLCIYYDVSLLSHLQLS